MTDERRRKLALECGPAVFPEMFDRQGRLKDEGELAYAKYCKDCRFFEQGERNLCHHPRNRYVDPVSGKFVDYECTWLRNLTRSDIETCGPEAKWFEALLR